ncbi:acetyltransferase putative [Entamoeba histolytica]|uniref:N-alpha-acetyltransferase 40 n=4 Tax=Entamoeba histolytica TaxID=5759 RepID=B1N4H5_ENTH1|nr:acetyltransferase, putative [Entamoeba histolytica HM-1:IMSS]EDS89133.1 acetyltransferase, putative [Entamoeba histolytica HM-1:IMSS]EMD45932.1 acetyltransferase, putative [Entamoeba histolytica KU27]ENY65975.1 acetyltransferase, putative [Entamoeba histolytica HM-1:IMSS-A]GAT98397.1 acetyltransferase putative [Entamoeba histolytica]|eukprot:XP_001914091.1 acetyltransferase, putative [Entamoeba histolytica HM-1:IMSS]
MRRTNQKATRGNLLLKMANELQLNNEKLTTHPIEIIPCKSIKKEQLQMCFELVKENMFSLDSVSSLGWNDHDKMEEMKQGNGFYILFKEGFVCIRFELFGNGIQCYLWEIQIKKEYRRQGIGKEMMNVIEIISKKAHCSEISLLVLKSNVEGKAFYDKLHFEVKKQDSKDQDYWIMRKKLN